MNQIILQNINIFQDWAWDITVRKLLKGVDEQVEGDYVYANIVKKVAQPTRGYRNKRVLVIQLEFSGATKQGVGRGHIGDLKQVKLPTNIVEEEGKQALEKFKEEMVQYVVNATKKQVEDFIIQTNSTVLLLSQEEVYEDKDLKGKIQEELKTNNQYHEEYKESILKMVRSRFKHTFDDNAQSYLTHEEQSYELINFKQVKENVQGINNFLWEYTR